MIKKTIPVALIIASAFLISGCNVTTPVEQGTEVIEDTKQLQEELDKQTEQLNDEDYLTDLGE